MKKAFLFLASLAFVTSLVATDFTLCSYNCGGLPDHYDYIRAVCMQKLSQERHSAEPISMDKLQKVQQVALTLLFSEDPEERQVAEEEWEKEKDFFAKITAHPDAADSVNKIWHEKSVEIVTTYKERPIVIHDEEVQRLLEEITGELGLDLFCREMAQRIFAHRLKYDILALQEADYLDPSLFPEKYEVHFSGGDHSINGFAWNRDRFSLVEAFEVGKCGLTLLLRDRETEERVAVATGHLKGCDPFRSGPDAEKGDQELLQILAALESADADIKVLAMDSNVTATHHRLSLLKEAGYKMDYTRYLEPTCTNPWQVLDTRIDWIAIQSPTATIVNIPVQGVGLNSPETNISDHKPVAVSIRGDI